MRDKDDVAVEAAQGAFKDRIVEYGDRWGLTGLTLRPLE